MNVAVVPARGGSKRIPRKNIADFGGRPLISYSIEAARQSGMFAEIIVSTDDAEIAEVARALGATVPFARPASLADDHTGTTAVMAHALDWLVAEGVEFDNACCLYATAPFLRPQDIIEGYKRLVDTDCNYVFSATRFAFPVFRGFVEAEDGGLRMLFPEHQLTRSQDLPEVFHDAAQFYWGRKKAWLEQLPIFDIWSSFVRLESWRVQDIDTPEDLERARLLQRAMHWTES